MNLPEGVAGPSARDAQRAVATRVSDLSPPRVAENPLGWPGYVDQLKAAARKSGVDEAVIIAEGEVGGQLATLISFDFNYLGGSMGTEAGRRITKAFAHALANRQPVISLVATGGARIQEGMPALVQMQRIAACVSRMRREGLLHLSVVRHPTTGGVWVSLAAAADIIVGIEGATASFAGERVRGAVDGDAVPDAFSVSGKLAHGFIDAVGSKHAVPALVARYLGLLNPERRHSQPAPAPVHPGATAPPSTGWAAVELTRSPSRPRALQYLESYFNERVAISGDRAGASDPEMLCGFGTHDGRTIAYVAQTGRPNAAAGFRTACRLLRLADRLGFPVLTLIDTPGARNDEEAERQGIGHAISDTLVAMAEIKTPVTSVLIGEGGSGGALALAHPDNLWVAPDSYFSVIAPEAAASIVYRDPSRAPEAAERLRLGPRHLIEMGIAVGITPGDVQ